MHNAHAWLYTCYLAEYYSLGVGNLCVFVVWVFGDTLEQIKFVSIMRTLRLIGTTLLMVVLCLNFTACGDDDDDDPSNPLVGVWQNDDEGEHLRWTFRNDGSGEEHLFYDDDSESYTYQFTYTYDSKSSTLIINYDDTDKYTININGNTMTAKMSMAQKLLIRRSNN